MTPADDTSKVSTSDLHGRAMSVYGIFQKRLKEYQATIDQCAYGGTRNNTNIAAQLPRVAGS